MHDNPPLYQKNKKNYDIFLVRATGVSSLAVRHAQYSTPSQGEKVEKVYPPNVPGYMYVNAEDPNMTMKSMSDRAAQTMFWTELARGFAVTLAHIFKASKYIFL